MAANLIVRQDFNWANLHATSIWQYGTCSLYAREERLLKVCNHVGGHIVQGRIVLSKVLGRHDACQESR